MVKVKIHNFGIKKPTVNPNVANKQTAVNSKLQLNFALNQNQTSQLLTLFSSLQITSYDQLIGYLNNPQMKQYLMKNQSPKFAQNMPNPNVTKEVPEISKDLLKLMQQFAESASRDHIIYSMVRKNILKARPNKEVNNAPAFVFTENLTKEGHTVHDKPKAELAINEYASSLITKPKKKLVNVKPSTSKEKDKKLIFTAIWACAFSIPIIVLLIWLLK